MNKYVLLTLLLACCLLATCNTSEMEAEEERKPDVDPSTQTEKLTGGTTFTSNSGGNKSLSGSPYGYEMWSAGGNNNKLIWYGADQGGGAAFRAEWNNPNDFLGRVGYYWGNGGAYTTYKNIYCDFNFTRSENGTAGRYSYIGIYGWSKNPLIEWYIVDDWFGNGIMGPSTIGSGATKVGEFRVNGANYYIYKAKRVNQPSINGTATFDQFFSIRQERRQCGTISVTRHFKEWEKLDMKLGSNMYECKFLVEAGGGTGWFDSTYLTFSME